MTASQCQRVGCHCCPAEGCCQTPPSTLVTVTYDTGESFTDECCTPCADVLTRSPRKGMTVTATSLIEA